MPLGPSSARCWSVSAIKLCSTAVHEKQYAYNQFRPSGSSGRLKPAPVCPAYCVSTVIRALTYTTLISLTSSGIRPTVHSKPAVLQCTVSVVYAGGSDDLLSESRMMVIGELGLD